MKEMEIMDMEDEDPIKSGNPETQRVNSRLGVAPILAPAGENIAAYKTPDGVEIKTADSPAQK